MSWPDDIPHGQLHRVVDVNAVLRLEEAGLPVIEAWQAHQWRLLQGWLMAHAPWWAERLQHNADWQAPGRWPVLSRAELQAMVAQHGAAPVPPSHGGLRTGYTSGSSGRPVQYFASQFTQRLIDHIYHADHLRQGRNPYALRAVIDSRTARHDGTHTTHEAQPGDGVGTLLTRRLEQFDMRSHLAWLSAHRPRYFTTTPSWLRAMMDTVEEHGIEPPPIEQVLTYATTVEAGERERARRLMGASIRDRYTCDECGPMAFQCPHSDGHYHVAVQNVRLEVVDAHGDACAPGETGRVLVTALHQYATPLVRYDIGDVAALHPACPGCGLGVPALSNLLGRRRFLLRLPDGSLTVPTMAAKHWRACAPVLEHRLVQTSLTEIRAEVVMATPLDGSQKEALLRKLREIVSDQLHYTLVEVARIERTASVKPQDVISLID